MRRALPLVLFLCTASAFAHNIVDVGVAIVAPAFAVSGSSQTYTINVTDFAYDNGSGIVVTLTTTNAQLVSASGTGWRCTEGSCSAELISPGPSQISITLKMPASGTAHIAANVQSLGTIDPNKKNDNAAADTQIYDPASCTAAAPQLLSPADATELSSGAVDLAWTSVPGASAYQVWTGVEGAAAQVVATTSGTQLHRDSETGVNEWWIEAVFDACPPVASLHRSFLSDGSPPTLSVTTFAGALGVAGDDDGTLATARFRTPASLGVDLDGNIYVADSEASTIRKIAPDGTVSTATGLPGRAVSNDGTKGFGTLDHPRALAVTPGGYVYIADTGGNSVRQFYPQGNGVVFSSFLATMMTMSAPAAIAVAPNNAVLTTDGAVIKQIAEPSIAVSTIALGFHAPSGIAVNASGNVFVADAIDNVIRRIAADGTVTAFAGAAGQAGFSDGLGALAHFNQPSALAFDALGNLYVADTANNAIRRIAPSTLVTTIVPPGALNAPAGIAFDNAGHLLIADSGNRVVRIATTAAVRRRSVVH
jgi:sugar lactone lactonase YvrE